MKKKYVQPTNKIFQTSLQLLANSFEGSSISIDSSQMEDGDGSDAVKAHSAWNDNWGDNWNEVWN